MDFTTLVVNIQINLGHVMYSFKKAPKNSKMDSSKIAILSTVNNFKLYKKSASLYPSNIKSYVFDGRNGMFGIFSITFMMKVFKRKDIDWLILMDEDALFVNSDLIYPLIDNMKVNDYIIAGIRDGGALPERSGNPYVMNPFFSIIHLKKLKKIWNKKEMFQNHYVRENEFNDDLSQLKYPYDKTSMSEPYYCFYLWLKRKNQKMLYLNVDLPFADDQITNVVYDLNNQPIVYHTWFSREYGDLRGRHTARIDRVFEEFENKYTDSKPVKIYKDYLFPFKDRVRKFKKHTRKRLMKIGLISEIKINKS
ncbi:hypothetical protein IUY40_03570 [Flavobacterium sp. ALJ2]|uniref:hypothetical protein n=1 Tax=Flavobacterium sp. ALJ2 TaxID=2786960 RepID=UPI00189FA489|nr:hypothetical protein [Flavobacterium sp. ALJ2]MBF7090620.1 hypothetical protein [Flavobacterium sp. ALJ2]